MTSLITNSTLIEKIRNSNKSECASWLISEDIRNEKHKPQSYMNIVNACVKKFTTLNKSKSRPDGKLNLDRFLNEKVNFPEISLHLRKPKDKDVSCDCSFKNVSFELAEEVLEIRNEKLKLAKECEQLSNVNIELKKSKIHKSTVKTLKNNLKHNKNVITSLQSSLDSKRSTLRRIRLQNSRLLVRNNNLKTRVEILEADCATSNETVDRKNELIEQLEGQISTAETNIRELHEHADWLADIADEENTVHFYDNINNKYSHELRQVIYELLSLHVSAHNVGPVIQSVLKLVGKTADKLPSKATILNCNVERLILSQKQLNEQLPDKKNLTLYTDETSKYGTKYSGYHASDETGKMYVVGMRELVTKSGQDTLSVFQEILDDIDQQSIEADLTSKRILMNITATMSDRASTEKRFNYLLQELRQTVLPELFVNWDQLSHENQVTASTILNFFCGLHSLVHFAESGNKSLIEVENGFFDGKGPISDVSFRKASESGALRLVRTASKALARGADEKSGKFRDFNVYVKEFLKDNQLNSLPLEPFRGNRFNILFESAVAVFFLRNKIQAFLASNQTNNLLKSVLHDIQITEYLAGVKALGLISRLVTGPLWCLIEDKSIHILAMNRHYLQLVNFLQDSAQNLDLFMSGQSMMFGDATKLQKDAMFVAITSPWEHDGKVQTCLQVMLPALSELALRIFADHLPGGKWENVTDQLKSKTASVQKHNKFAESVFGYLDQLLRKKPNISVISSEAYIMFTANKTQEWLNSKDEESRKKLIDYACKSVEKVRKNFKVRKQQIEQKQRELLAQSIEKSEQEEARRLERLEKFTDKVILYGLWQSEESVDNELKSVKTKTDKVDALKAQLNFRRYVLAQKPKKAEYEDVYVFSKLVGGTRRQLSVDELAANVKKLVRHAYSIEPAPADNNIPLLKGKSIQHKFGTDGEDRWYSGTVISQVPGYPAWYNVIYENDIAVYSYRLLQDYEEGNLKILVTE